MKASKFTDAQKAFVIKQFRGIATRYDKDAANYLAAIKLICARLWCNA